MAKRIYADGGYIVIDEDSGGRNKYVQKLTSKFTFDGANYQINGDMGGSGDYYSIPLSESESWYDKSGLAAYTQSTLLGFLLEHIGGQLSGTYQYEVAKGKREGKSLWNNSGYNDHIDSTDQEIITSWGGVFNPTTDIISTAQTFTITYNSTTDGAGTTGALTLFIDYLDENDDLASATHTLGNDGSDVTAFTGKGINKAVVLSNGGSGVNTNDITFTATTDTTTQAQIPALISVTQQAIFHTPRSYSFLPDWILANAGKISGGGAVHKLEIFGYSWSRVKETKYEILRALFDTDVQNFAEIKPPHPIIIGEREVLYFESSSDTNHTEVILRFSGNLESV